MVEKVIFSAFTSYPLLSDNSDCSISVDAPSVPIMILYEQGISVPVPVETPILNDSNSLQEILLGNSCTFKSKGFHKTMYKPQSKPTGYGQNSMHYHYEAQNIIELLYLLVVSCVALYFYFGFHRKSIQKQIETITNENKSMNNVQIILDYDDTIFPTHYAMNNMDKDQPINSTEWDQLKELNAIVYQALLMWIELFGAQNICIVSNAHLSWMNQTCFIYNGLYQNIRHLITLHQIEVISARDSYKSDKCTAFMSVLKNKNNINKAICIGDSEQEYNCIDTACSVMQLRRRRRQGRRNINGSMTYCRVKLADQPSLNTMIKQLKSLKNLDYAMISQHYYNESYVF